MSITMMVVAVGTVASVETCAVMGRHGMPAAVNLTPDVCFLATLAAFYVTVRSLASSEITTGGD